MPGEGPPRSADRGGWLIVVLFAFGILFLGALFLFTAGRRAAPPPEFRTESR